MRTGLASVPGLWASVTCAFALAIGFTPMAQAADVAKCHVQVTGSEAERWREQAALLVRDMQTQGLDNACTELSIDADAGRARLTFATADGRVAHRELLDPAELVPTVQALSVGGEDASASAAV